MHVIVKFYLCCAPTKVPILRGVRGGRCYTCSSSGGGGGHASQRVGVGLGYLCSLCRLDAAGHY